MRRAIKNAEHTLLPRFRSSPLTIRVTFSLLFGLKGEPNKEKGKRVLLGNLATAYGCCAEHEDETEKPRGFSRRDEYEYE